MHFWYAPPPKATAAQDFTGAKTLGHWWCSSCKLMGVDTGTAACDKCKGGVEKYAALERTVR